MLTQFLGKLLPANPEIQEILKKIREKYDLPEIEPGDDPQESYLIEGLDREAIYQEIHKEVSEIDGLFENSLKNLYKLYLEGEENFPVPEDFLDARPEYQEKARQLYLQLTRMFTGNFKQIDQMIDQITAHTFYYLTTGDTLPTDESWMGRVYVTQFNDQPAVVAIAPAFTDLNLIVGKFRAEHRRLFGKQVKVTKGRLRSADYLRKKLEGKSYRDIADHYILRHTSEFPTDPRSKAYREAKKKLEERVKKEVQRSKSFLEQKLGDKIE